MEKYLLEEFEKELSQIKEYIKHIQQVNDLTAIEVPNEPIFQEFKTHFLSFRKGKKLFEYKAIIISLYGLLEKHIEQWVQAYLTRLSSFVAYDQLSRNLQDKHFEVSIKLINIISERRQEKYNHLKKEDVLKKLNTCIENPKSYNFNVEAFTIQAGNLTHKRIEDIFKVIDINISKEIIKNKNFVSLTGLSKNQLSNTEHDILFGKINELVERRNTIAHGSKIDDLLDLSALKPFIEFLEKYCTAIFEVINEKDIKNQTIGKYQKVTCVGIFHKKTVIGIYIENYSIKLNDWIIIKTPKEGEEHFYKKSIKSLGKGGINNYEELQIVEGENIGIENQDSLSITKQCTFYLEIKQQ